MEKRNNRLICHQYRLINESKASIDDFIQLTKTALENDRISSTDLMIADEVTKIVSNNSAVHREKLKIQVSEGRVSINGTVEWNFQPAYLLCVILQLKGVIDVRLLMFASG